MEVHLLRLFVDATALLLGLGREPKKLAPWYMGGVVALLICGQGRLPLSNLWAGATSTDQRTLLGFAWIYA